MYAVLVVFAELPGGDAPPRSGTVAGPFSAYSEALQPAFAQDAKGLEAGTAIAITDPHGKPGTEKTIWEPPEARVRAGQRTLTGHGAVYCSV